MAQDATKARLLEAAGEEFADKGFEGATIRAIIVRAKANIAAVNYHFGDKERLYIQAVLEAHRCGFEASSPDEDEELPAAERLRRHVHDFLEHILAIGNAESWHHRLMLREITRPTSASEALVREVIRPKYERLVKILRRACPDADEKRLIALAFSVTGQCLHYKIARPIAERLIGPEAFAALDLDYLTNHITGFTLAALGLAPPVGCEDWTHSEAACGGQGGSR